MTHTHLDNPVVKTLWETIDKGIEQITAANEILLGDDADGKTSVREIDKIVKDAADPESSTEVPESITKAFARYQKAQAAAKAAQSEYRNLYRTEVLGEEEVTSSEDEVDKDALKDTYAAVKKSIEFLVSFAKGNGLKDTVQEAESLAVPQVGRRGTSSATGVKRPRVYVDVDGDIYNSFTEAALALTSKDNKVTAADLNEAWDQEDGSSFTFGEHTVKVTAKPKKSEG